MALGFNVAPGVYEIGNIVRLHGIFQVLGVNTDPTTITVTIEAPDKTETSATGGQLTHESTGQYHYDYTIPAQAGNYNYRWVGTGACVSASEGNFIVVSKQTP